MNPKIPAITGNVFSPESSEILDHLPILICKFLPDTTLTYINQTCCNTFGKTKQELYAVQWIHFLPETLKNSVMDILKNVKNTLVPETNSYEMKNRSGEPMIVEWKIYPVLDTQNQFQGFLGVGTDKTKEAQAAHEVKKKDELLRNVLATLDDVIWSVDAKEMKLLYVSEGAKKIYGVEPEKFYADNHLWIDMIHSEDRHFADRKVEDLFQLGKPYSEVEYRIVRPDGEVRYISDRSWTVFDEAGKPDRIEGITRDISVETRFKNEVENIKSTIHSIINNTNDMIWSVDKNFKLTYFNEPMRKSYELYTGKILKNGMSLEEVISDSEIRKQFETVYTKALQNEHFTHYYNLYGKTYEFSLNPITDNKEITGVAIFSRDISDRVVLSEKLEKSEENLRALIENTQDSIWSVDKSYKILTMNHLFHEAIFNIYKIDLKIGSNILEQFEADISSTWKEIYDSTFAGNSIRKEWEIPNQNGTSNYYEILTSPIYSFTENMQIPFPKDRSFFLSENLYDQKSKNEQSISGATIYIRDITERKLYEQKSIGVIKSKDRLLAAVAHDLKNPISGILSLTELLKEQASDPNNVELLNMMSQAANKSLNIIQDLLQIAEMENESYKLKFEKTNLNHLIQSLVKQNLPEAESKKIKLYARMETDPIPVQVELLKFQRVLENLISNSLKFTKEGGEISIHSYSQNKKAIIIVEDTGIGIPFGLQSAIFDQFTRAKRQGLKGEQTTGLGMSIVKVIVELHKGKISLESEEGIGTKFIIEIPLDL
ncbi:PAS domain S-box protein [Leptospira kmetyi]|nr:PAS domain S-box protein [Leptospira kmetyi]